MKDKKIYITPFHSEVGKETKEDKIILTLYGEPTNAKDPKTRLIIEIELENWIIKYLIKDLKVSVLKQLNRVKERLNLFA